MFFRKTVRGCKLFFSFFLLSVFANSSTWEMLVLLSTPLSFLLSFSQERQTREQGVRGSIYKEEQDTSASFKGTDKRQGNMQLFLAIVVTLSACHLAVGIEDEDAISGKAIICSNLFQTEMLHSLCH
jgi:hypothetical protein